MDTLYDNKERLTFNRAVLYPNWVNSVQFKAESEYSAEYSAELTEFYNTGQDNIVHRPHRLFSIESFSFKFGCYLRTQIFGHFLLKVGSIHGGQTLLIYLKKQLSSFQKPLIIRNLIKTLTHLLKDFRQAELLECICSEINEVNNHFEMYSLLLQKYSELEELKQLAFNLVKSREWFSKKDIWPNGNSSSTAERVVCYA
ncbi:hypothetical protein LXL04_015819 [Taraxacum kok-saghyz]